jgi:glycosyltransferase involved in cell wall biosynthesis
MQIIKESAGKTLMLVENSFPGDVRVRNEAYLLKNAGYKVIVIALNKKGAKFKENIDGIQVYRIPELSIFKKTSNPNASYFKKLLNKVKSLLGYPFEYLYFTSACFCLSICLFIKEGFDVVHAHNPPDTLFLIGGFYKLFGKKFVFDHHDLSPELYESRFGVSGGMVYKSLMLLENLSLRLSDIAIATNETYKEIQINRGGIKPENVYVVRNGPDLNRVKLVPTDEKLKAMGKTILGYIGAMNPQDGVDYLLRSLSHLVYKLKRSDFYCVIIGSGDSFEDLKSIAKELKIENHVWFTGIISDDDVFRYLSTADICIGPDPSSPLNDVSTWIKIMEYMALGKPIVSFDLKETRYSAQEAAIYIEPNDEAKFAQAIAKLMDDADLRKKLGEFGKKRVENCLKWEIVGQNLIRAYESLTIK